MILESTNELPYIPKRIVSMVPSQTELLHWLGLEQETVGITKFCVHPSAWFSSKTRIGGTKSINPKIIDSLQPDLIIANREENLKEQVEELAVHYPVWVTDIQNLNNALQMITDIGRLTQKNNEAALLIKEIRFRFGQLIPRQQTTSQKLRTAYLIWRHPYMTIGGDTFIHDMLVKCGFENIFADKCRYPETTVSELRTANCQLLLLSSEPYPFKREHIAELQESLPDTTILLADGEMFSWYGSRLLEAPGYFYGLMSNFI